MPAALVLCETSGEVRRRINTRLGWTAYSVDILPADDGEQNYHVVRDVLDLLKALPRDSYDLIVAHPPCTALAVSGNRWYGEGMVKHQQRLDSVQWTAELWLEAKRVAKHVAFENPVGVLNKYSDVFPKPSYIQPWQFGHGETKKTGLWLHNLPELKPTNIVEGREQRIWKMPPGPDRWKERSKTYSGIVEAIVDQWCLYVEYYKGAGYEATESSGEVCP